MTRLAGGVFGLAFVLVLASGCSASLDEKLGGAGEECIFDGDCHEDFVCIDAKCALGRHDCSVACDRFVLCEASGADECIDSCRRNTAAMDDERFEDYEDCIEIQTCSVLQSQADSCLTHDCRPVCRQLEGCGVETMETCLTTCQQNTAGWTRTEFSHFEQCLFSLPCSEVSSGSESCFPTDDG